MGSRDRTVTLGGVEYVVPELAIMQQETIFPAMQELADRREQAAASRFPTREMIHLLSVITHAGISALNPELTLDAFKRLPGVSIAELSKAVVVIAHQAGIEFKAAGEGAATAADPPLAT